MNGFFKGRTLAVIDDFSIAERRYLFARTRELKEALLSGDARRIDAFRIGEQGPGVYEVFLEDSTRTRESFSNAAKFHRVKISALNADSSSFNKGESYADTFNTLIGYENRIFIIRSKLEGVCRWLEQSASAYACRNGIPGRPSFINAGDGRHEHPTQELLDEFTFIEDNGWKTNSLHIALVGDLYHGRTVHSKADGLTVFDYVRVDLVAPDELSLPDEYVGRMERHGFTVRKFTSIAEYLEQPDIAAKWYFTRPQLERMGDRVLRRQEELRKAITFSREFLDRLPPGTLFYHPLPRNKVNPVIPTYLDTTGLNGWERQSANGMLVRIVLLGLISGHLGDDFKVGKDRPSTAARDDDFIEAVGPEDAAAAGSVEEKRYSEGVRPIRDGIVIDHICRGESSGEIRSHMHLIVSLLGLHGKGGEWVSTSRQDPGTLKGIIFRPSHPGMDLPDIRRLAAAAPGCTLNIIRSGAVVEKFRLSLPPRIEHISGLACRNEACISYPEHHEDVPARFLRTAEGQLACVYCGRRHSFKEVWQLGQIGRLT